MAADKIRVVAWLFAALVVSGLCMIFAGKVLQAPLGVIHKLLAILCVVALLRNVGVFRALEGPPALFAALAVFAVACGAAFATGIVQSIPACASSVWLNLHRVAAATAVVACVFAFRLMAMAVRA